MLLLLLPLFFPLCLAGAVFGDATAKRPQISVPSFTLEELNLGTRSSDLLQALRTAGLFSVHVGDQDGHSIHRSMAMNGLCDCSESLAALTSNSDYNNGFVEGLDSVLLDDQVTRRTTIATATVGSSPLPLASRDVLEATCGRGTVAAMEMVRDHVAQVSEAFVQALDRLAMDNHQNNDQVPLLLVDKQGGSYSTLKSIVQSANHLEHFHHYSKEIVHQEGKSNKNDEEEDGSHLTLDWHTDAGLFLAFLPAWDCHSTGAALDASFWVQLPDGQRMQAKFDPGTVVIMMGAGAEHWLRNDFLGLRATRHAVRMENGAARTWYGMSK